MRNYEWTTQKNTSCGFQEPVFSLPANSSKKICDYLELLQNTHNINLMTNIFSNLGIYTLSKNIGSEIVKYELLYEKILFVLNSGLQVKITITLNFISALLYLDEDGPTRKKALNIYTQNMLRNSGCLTAMSNIFASFILHQETLKALCHCISETVRGSSINQSFCSHLVPLCIQKCRSGSSEIFAVLQSLLNKHKRNVQLFHQNNGMELFSRVTMQSTLCLQLLNTVIENAQSEERDIILNSSHIFEYLLNLLKKYGASTPVSQWASIILYSYQKVLGINVNVESILSNVFIDEHRKSLFSTSLSTKQYPHCTINPELNETKELFRNILNEIIVSKGRRKFNDDIRFQLKCENANSNIGLRNRQYLKARERQTNISKPQMTRQNNDLSFSFLLHENKTQNKVYNHLESYRSKSIINDQNSIRNVVYSSNYDIDQQHRQHLTQNWTRMLDANKTLLQNSDKESSLDFQPFFASTPKKRKTTVNLKSISQASPPTTMRKFTCRSRDSNMRKISRTKREYKKADNRLRNKSVSAKFLDIVNASCTTIVKSFTTFKNIFKSKKASEKNDSNTEHTLVDTCSYSFTNYMRERDAILKSNKENIEHSKQISVFSLEVNSLNDCNTCNDTIALKQKLANISSLQRTVKRLKMGINLYGCDFKKISKAMWPQEKYMTPSVLYNLYRKLIIK